MKKLQEIKTKGVPKTKKVSKTVAKVVKKFTKFRTLIFSRHPSHAPLRTLLALLSFRSVVRLGSTTDKDDTVTNGGRRIECNTIDAVKTSASKLRMKLAFLKAGVITALWGEAITADHINNDAIQFNTDKNGCEGLEYPIVAKHIHGSRGTGNYLLKTRAELEAWVVGKNLTNYIFEKFYDYSREYRLHVTKAGCFYTCRKMLKSDTPDNRRWFRNDSNSTWVLETNPAFDKPVNWDKIVEESVKALSSVGLDIGAIDVKVQSAKNSKGEARKEPKFIILETNSAPSFGEVTLEKYLVEIPKVLKAKFAEI